MALEDAVADGIISFRQYAEHMGLVEKQNQWLADADEAIKRTTWTTDQPTEPGYYRAAYADKSGKQIVQVVYNDYEKAMLVYEIGNELYSPISEYGYWLGPIADQEIP